MSTLAAPPTPTAQGAVIALRDVRKVYRLGEQDVHALAGVTIDFQHGEFVAIMGPSGSGKSTMLNLLGCLDRPNSGSYRLDGYDVSTLTDDELADLRLQRLGFVFQSFNLIAQLTVQENIELPMFYGGQDADATRARARELAERVGLSERLGHRPAQLSGGQQQRVAIARALANDPPVLLADEPTGNLDSATGDQIMALLTELNQQGRTIVMVTHEDNIAAFAQRRVHMRDGVIDRID